MPRLPIPSGQFEFEPLVGQVRYINRVCSQQGNKKDVTKCDIRLIVHDEVSELFNGAFVVYAGFFQGIIFALLFANLGISSL